MYLSITVNCLQIYNFLLILHFFFKNIIENLKEKNNAPVLQVKLKDAVPEAFELVLTYIYTDRIDPTKKSEY